MVKLVMWAGPYLLPVALISALIAILKGFLLGRYGLNLSRTILTGAPCGGMTSTTGTGVAIDTTKSSVVICGYGATHPFALIGMDIFP